MVFFNNTVTVLQTLIVALGADLGIWRAINLLESYGNDNPVRTKRGCIMGRQVFSHGHTLSFSCI